ncbi:hypothetical protein LWC33_24150 [Pseudonocardia sp. RS11V-5]|uniref:hypothetical protein n=1 Tax=Pseudonocardia terrae TaxID=2905831 RepID=UPI001E37C70B|nr:hypothetical protein [Pseudonocardia terrae]MCE3554535.1 hypothetical protein [Pseudonocardia terrae]
MGDRDAEDQLVELASERGDLVELRRLAAAGLERCLPRIVNRQFPPLALGWAVLLPLAAAAGLIPQWARRELDQAGRREAYLAGVAKAARLAGEGGENLVDLVSRMITEVLDLDECRFTPELPRQDRPRLTSDGSVWRGRTVDVEREGFPTMDVVELPVRDGVGTFLLTASTRARRPSVEQRQVAVTLASQIGLTSALPER